MIIILDWSPFIPNFNANLIAKVSEQKLIIS